MKFFAFEQVDCEKIRLQSVCEIHMRFSILSAFTFVRRHVSVFQSAWLTCRRIYGLSGSSFFFFFFKKRSKGKWLEGLYFSITNNMLLILQIYVTNSWFKLFLKVHKYFVGNKRLKSLCRLDKLEISYSATKKLQNASSKWRSRLHWPKFVSRQNLFI